MLGLMSDMRLSACTTSGQLVHVSETYVFSTILPFSDFILRCIASSGKFLPCPSVLRTARRSDVNSCPFGIPRNVIPVSLPSFSSLKLSCVFSFSVKLTDNFSDVEAISLRNSSSPAFFSSSFLLVAAKVICDLSDANMPLTWSDIFLSNIFLLFKLVCIVCYRMQSS